MRPLLEKLCGRMMQAGTNWGKHRDDVWAAGLSYYLALSLVPLMLVLVAVLGGVLALSDWGQDARDQLLTRLADETSQALASEVRLLLDDVETNAALGGPMGMLGLMIAGAVILVHLQRAFDDIWEYQVAENAQGFWQELFHLVMHRFRAIVLLAGLGVLAVLVFLADTLVLQTLLHWTRRDGSAQADVLRWQGLVTNLVYNMLFLVLMYRLVPREKPPWMAVARGAFFTAVVWEIGRQVFARLLIGDRFSAYGVLGVLMSLMLWLYYASAVLMLGAEYVRVLQQEQESARPAAGVSKSSAKA